MLQLQTLWPGSQRPSSHRRGSGACVSLVEILVVERARLLLHQVQPGLAAEAILGQRRPVPAGTPEQGPPRGADESMLGCLEFSLPWNPAGMSPLGPAGSHCFWEHSFGNSTVGQGGKGWGPHGPHFCGQWVLMAFVAMLALTPWKLTSACPCPPLASGSCLP